MTNKNEIKCYKSVSCILAVFMIVFIFGAIIVDLAFTKPSIRRDISEINKELIITNQHIDRLDSLQKQTNGKFVEFMSAQSKDKILNKQ